MRNQNVIQPILMVILDGAADRCQEALDECTPFQSAKLPNLDSLSKDGTVGLLNVGPSTVSPDSTTAHGLLWGLSREEIPGRSLLEAHERGVDFQEHDTFAYVHFSHVTDRNESFWIKQRHPDSQPLERIDEFCNREHSLGSWTFELRRLNDFRGILLGRYSREPFEGPIRLTDSDPFSDHFPVIRPQLRQPQVANSPERDYKDAIEELVERSWGFFGSYERLLVPYWHTSLIEPSIQSPLSHWGIESYSFTPKKGVRGLADCLGFDLGEPVEDFNERVKLALEKLEEYDLVHLHFPEPDNFSHTNEPEKKKEMLQSIDQSLGLLRDELPGLLVVTPDHTTPCRNFSDHTGDPVPLLMKGSETRVDNVKQYDEVSVANGGLGTLTTQDLFGRMIDYSGRSMLNQVHRDPETKGRVNASKVERFPT